MAELNHYETLQVSPQATQTDIKRSYRRLAKIYHPDKQQDTADREQIVQLNAAYEVLGDPQRRVSYDREIQNPPSTQSGNWEQRAKTAQTQYQKRRYTTQDTDDQIQQWLHQVYQPVNRLLCRILNSLENQIDELSADPFDDELLEAFQDYLQNCREFLEQAQFYFRSIPNPAPLASVAASLYYCLNQVGDGIEELQFFTLNYDDNYLHTGQEMFRIAIGLRREAQAALKSVV